MQFTLKKTPLKVVQVSDSSQADRITYKINEPVKKQILERLIAQVLRHIITLPEADDHDYIGFEYVYTMSNREDNRVFDCKVVFRNLANEDDVNTFPIGKSIYTMEQLEKFMGYESRIVKPGPNRSAQVQSIALQASCLLPYFAVAGVLYKAVTVSLPIAYTIATCTGLLLIGMLMAFAHYVTYETEPSRKFEKYIIPILCGQSLLFFGSLLWALVSVGIQMQTYRKTPNIGRSFFSFARM